MDDQTRAFLDELEAEHGKACRRAAERFITAPEEHPAKKTKPRAHPAAAFADGHIQDHVIRRVWR